MPQLNIDRTTTPTIIQDASAEPLQTEGVNEAGETWITYPEFTKWNGYYRSKNKSYSKVRISINAYANWVLGQGWTANRVTTLTLENVTGAGEDTFLSLLWNQIVVKKFNGDSFAEIVREPDIGGLLNLKPLDPSSITSFWNPEGILIRYEQTTKTGKETDVRELKPGQMLHLMNDRYADSLRGVSIIEAVEWNLLAQEEARRMFRKKVKNSGILGVIEADTEDTTKLENLKAPIKKGVEEGTFLIIPKDVLKATDWVSNLNTQEIIQWLKYLDDEFYMIIGIPKIILGGSGEIEGDAKMSYTAFEQIYKREINELKDDIWNQMALRVDFNLPVSIANTIADNEIKNASQVGFQSNDTTAGVGE